MDYREIYNIIIVISIMFIICLFYMIYLLI